MRKSKLFLFGIILALAVFCGTFMSACAADSNDEPKNDVAAQTTEAQTVETENESEVSNETMNIQIGEYTFTATLEDNAAVDELVEMLKQGEVTISMTDYSGFEKVGSLGQSLTASDSQTTTEEGDIVLYNSNNIVMFYGSNSWSYTRIGKIDDLTNWRTALGRGSITAVFSLPE